MNEPQPKANMIETCNSYKVGDRLFESFEAAQLHALTDLFESIAADSSSKTLAEHLYTNKDEILTILAMSEPTPKARKPRSDQGKPHRRKKKSVAANPESAPIESTVTGSGKYSGK